MSHLIASSSVEIHDNTISCDAFSPEFDFGVLSLKFSKVGINKTPTFILFTIDKTGSMLEQNRMKYVKNTFKNIIDFISTHENDSEIYIRVHAFNDSVDVLVNTTRVTKNNIDAIIQSIMAIEPDGSTAIDMALTESSNTMNEYRDSNPTHSVFHIFMTDGEPTIGIRNHASLAELVDTDFPSMFIGFGHAHNSDLLRRLSESPIHRYEFVDNMEHTGLVYGNIIHELLYRSISNLEIKVENGFIYNWVDNQWASSIIEPNVVGDSSKFYHLKTTSAVDLAVKIYGTPMDTGGTQLLLGSDMMMPDLENVETGELQSSRVDLSKYMYRQVVQEIMYKSRSIHSNIAESMRENVKKCKKETSDVFSKIRRFMRQKNLLTDRMMIQLCDDLCIIHRTVGTQNGRMFTLAREQSQGRQQSNTVPMTPRPRFPSFENEDRLSPPKLVRRQTSTNQTELLPFISSITPIRHNLDENDFSETDHVFSMNGVEEDDITTYIMDDDPISCFASPSAVDTMRSITQSDLY